MKLNELKTTLRALIREEVKKVVADEVNKAMGKVLVEMVKEIKYSPSENKTVNESVEHEKSTDVAAIKTNNPKLNSALADTAKNFKPLKKTSDSTSLTELMGGDFEK